MIRPMPDGFQPEHLPANSGEPIRAAGGGIDLDQCALPLAHSFSSGHSWIRRRIAVPMESIVVTAMVASVFMIFGAALAYGQYQTRGLESATDAAQRPSIVEDRWREAA